MLGGKYLMCRPNFYIIEGAVKTSIEKYNLLG